MCVERLFPILLQFLRRCRIKGLSRTAASADTGTRKGNWFGVENLVTWIYVIISQSLSFGHMHSTIQQCKITKVL